MTSRAGDAVRARAPHVLDGYGEIRESVLDSGIVEPELKELCRRYLAGELDGHAQHNERDRAALDWAGAIAWDADRADDALWRRLHASFTEPELVELGYSIAIMLGQQHWLATLGMVE
jgi:alkylhydroperoxidase family enzyme